METFCNKWLTRHPVESIQRGEITMAGIILGTLHGRNRPKATHQRRDMVQKKTERSKFSTRDKGRSKGIEIETERQGTWRASLSRLVQLGCRIQTGEVQQPGLHSFCKVRCSGMIDVKSDGQNLVLGFITCKLCNLKQNKFSSWKCASL